MSKFKFRLKAGQTLSAAIKTLESNLNARGIDHQVTPDSEIPDTYILTTADASGALASLRNKLRISDTESTLRLVGDIIPAQYADSLPIAPRSTTIPGASRSR